MAKLTRLPIDVSDLSGLAPSDLKYIGEYCTNNFDEVGAYRKVFAHRISGKSEPEIRLDAFDILNRREVKIAIQRFVDSVLGPAQDKLDFQLMQVLRKRAFFNVNSFFHRDGSPKKLSEIEPEDMLVIDGVTQTANGKNADVIVTTLKLGDRNTAIKMLQELLKKKDEIVEGGEQITTDESRKRIRDIFAGVEKGLNIAKRFQNAPNLREEPEVAECSTNDKEIENKAIIDAQDVESHPAVVKAKQLVASENAGFGIDGSALVEKARKIAQTVVANRGRPKNG